MCLSRFAGRLLLLAVLVFTSLAPQPAPAANLCSCASRCRAAETRCLATSDLRRTAAESECRSDLAVRKATCRNTRAGSILKCMSLECPDTATVRNCRQESGEWLRSCNQFGRSEFNTCMDAAADAADLREGDCAEVSEICRATCS